MGSTDFGTQTQSFDFNEAADSENFNKVNYELHQPGIYSGGALSRVDSDTIQVATLTCYIIDSTTGNGVRISTAATVDLDVTSGTNYIILRFDWDNIAANYMDFLAVGFGSIGADDLIIGKAVFFGATLQTTFDYTRQDTGFVAELAANDLELKVQSSNAPDNTVYVNGGTIRGIHDIITVTGASSGAISGTTAGRIDLVWIDDSGAIQITEGVDAGSPVSPDYDLKFVIAEIERGASRTVIDGNEITQINPVNHNLLYELSLATEDDGASLIGIWDTGGFFAATDVEAALAELASGFSPSFVDLEVTNILTVDTINEYTGATGVTIEGILLDTNVISIPGASITFSGANADRTIRLASDATIFWDETDDRVEFDKVVDLASGFRAGNAEDLKIKIIDIGDWNMDTSSSVDVTHGLTYDSIRGISGVVRGDAGEDDRLFAIGSVTTVGAGDVDVSFVYINATIIRIGRLNAGQFDNAGYNSTSYNRGWVHITYAV